MIIVSACYADGFIEPLRGLTTLVMTAADATHTSFGCGAASGFTYFAKTLFDEQLRTTRSFERAFAAALPVVREREQGQEFSNRQVALGEQMRARLAEIERRRARPLAPAAINGVAVPGGIAEWQQENAGQPFESLLVAPALEADRHAVMPGLRLIPIGSK